MRYGLCSAFRNEKKKKWRHFVNTFAQFTNVLSIHHDFYEWKKMGDNQKGLFCNWQY
jgi:putative SOS response-associated peptidase YedK